MNQTHNNNTPKIVGASLMTLFLAVAVYAFVIKSKNDTTSLSSNTVKTSTTSTAQSSDADQANTDTTTPESSTNNATPSSSSATKYMDGSYTVTIRYRVSRGANDLEVTLNLKDDKISSVATKSSYHDEESVRYINGFESKIQSAVKGKALSSLSVGRVGGASLTSSAFDEAVIQIKDDAQI